MEQNNLLTQLKTNNFKNLLFTIYNFIEDEGFVAEVNNKYNNALYTIDGFEYMLFNISNEDKKLIKRGNRKILQKYNDFKYHVEKELQNGFALCRIYIMRDMGIMFAVKTKDFDIATIFNEK